MCSNKYKFDNDFYQALLELGISINPGKKIHDRFGSLNSDQIKEGYSPEFQKAMDDYFDGGINGIKSNF